MTKKELVKSVSALTGYKRTEVYDILFGITEAIADELARGNEVQLTGFGTFSTKEMSGFTARGFNQEEINVPNRIVPVFRAGAELRRKVCKDL